jgi:ABC-type oligopeptide transport system ATPase subunit
MSRAAKQIIILGFNGTGKTTLSKKFVKAEIKRGGKVLVITPDFAEWTDLEETYLDKKEDWEFTGARRYIWEDPKILKRINRYWHDGLILFDDCRAYLAAVTDPELKRLYIRRRQKMTDIIMCGHGFTDVPPQAFTNCSEFDLFLTKDNIQRRKNVILNYDRILEAQQRINEKAETENYHYYEIIKP